MNFNDYQEKATSTALETAFRPEYLLPGLAAEAGEVCGKYAKYVRDVHPDAKPVNTPTYAKLREGIGKELGDVLWFVAVIAEFYQLRLADVAAGNIAKLESRVKRGVVGGSGDER